MKSGAICLKRAQFYTADQKSAFSKEDETIRVFMANSPEVHIANDKADETILNLVDDENTFVLSNDKFKDFFDKKAVKNDQILSF